MIKKKRYNIIRIIYDDLCIYGKFQLFILLLIFISAMLIVIITYETRCKVIQREELLMDKRVLEIEWNNLLLEEKILSDHSRVERIAKDILHMRYINVMKNNSFIEL